MTEIVGRLREIAADIYTEHGVLPPYTLVVHDGEGNSVALDFTVEINFEARPRTHGQPTG